MTTFDIQGRGWAFPLRLAEDGIRPLFTEGETRIIESIKAIVYTDVRERPHRIKNGIPYGTRIMHVLFENITAAMDIAKFDTVRALRVWEPRIVVSGVEATQQKIQNINVLLLDIAFIFRESNRADNLVLPFRSNPFREKLGIEVT